MCHVSGLVFTATKVQGTVLTLHRFAGDTYSKDHGGTLGVLVGDVLQLYNHKTGSILGEYPSLTLGEYPSLTLARSVPFSNCTLCTVY